MPHPRLLLALAVLVAGCASTETGPDDLVSAICSVQDALGDSDVQAAAARFERRAHPAIHDLVDELDGTDRAIAGAVQVAKFNVEEVLRGELPSPDDSEAITNAQERVEALQFQVRRAHEALDRPTPDC